MHTQFHCYLLIRDISRSFILDDVFFISFFLVSNCYLFSTFIICHVDYMYKAELS